MKRYNVILLVIFIFGAVNYSFAQEEENYRRYLMEKSQSNKEKAKIYVVTVDPEQPEKVVYIPINQQTDPESQDDDKKKEKETESQNVSENTSGNTPDKLGQSNREPEIKSEIKKPVTTTNPPARSSKPDEVEDNDSVLTYNFIYLLFQKFKFAEIIE